MAFFVPKWQKNKILAEKNTPCPKALEVAIRVLPKPNYMVSGGAANQLHTLPDTNMWPLKNDGKGR